MSLTIELEEDEALVLYELLASKKLEDAVEKPERNALWVLEGLLENKLVAPFSPDYKELLEVSRKSLLGRYGR